MFKKVKTSLKNVASWGSEPFYGPGFGSYLLSINSLPFLYYLHPLINKFQEPTRIRARCECDTTVATVLTTCPSLEDLAVLLSWIRSTAPKYYPSRFSSLDVSKTLFAETRYFSDDDYLDKVTSYLREERLGISSEGKEESKRLHMIYGRFLKNSVLPLEFLELLALSCFPTDELWNRVTHI